MGGALIAISAPVYWLGLSRSSCSERHRSSSTCCPAPAATRRSRRTPGSGSLAPPAVDRALRRVRRLLRAHDPRQPDRGAGEDYIRTARSKGLSERRVVLHHGLRAALTPVVTMAGSTSASSSAARFSPRRSSTSPGSAATPTTRSSTSTCRRSRARCCSARSSSSSRTSFVDIVYAFLDPRVRY